MIVRSKAPLRIGLAGGGTDVSPFCDMFGGAILNATISLYAHASIEEIDTNEIIFHAVDKGELVQCAVQDVLPYDGKLDLVKAVYNRLVKDFEIKPFSFRLTTFVDVPPGSGLGTSSTLVVAILGAFVEKFKLPLGEYDIAHLAFEIERVDLGMAGGRQDQYAATFGGVNFMEFGENDKVIVNPLRINSEYLYELEHNLVLFYTETSRYSSEIIENQSKKVIEGSTNSIEATKSLKLQSLQMKEALLKGELGKIGEILDYGWENKKMLTEGITNDVIDNIYNTAKKHGASGGKISGAGGGGFMIFYCPANTKFSVIPALESLGGSVKPYVFTKSGMKSWSI